MNIRETFLKLTQFTYPHGTEDKLRPFLPKGFQEDDFGNYFIKIGDSDTMFTCHLDTCSSHYQKVNHDIGAQFIKTDGKTILGADDKAGMTVLLYMIENKIPGLYYFFIGEEVGGIGSSAASSMSFSEYNKCISFDRRGYDSVITEQWFGKCCSDEFAQSLSDELNKKNLTFNFQPDPTGVFTDSASFMYDIPECTNISVGYFSEHQVTETQDISFLVRLCEAVIKVDWNSLPVMRDPNEPYTPYTSYRTNTLNEEDTALSATINVWIDEVKWSVKLTNERIIEERSHIYGWVIRQGSYYDLESIDWDGKTAYINYGGINEYLGDREDLMYMIDELENIPLTGLDLIKQIG
jgi:hypothetical protein